MLELAVLTIFPGLLVIAAVGDLLTYRIPNWLSAAVACLFVVTALFAGLEWTAIGVHTALGLILLLIGMGLFALKVLGGGDAKLLAAIGLWMGWAAMPAYVVWVALAGGALAALVLLFRRLPLPEGFAAPAWISRLHKKHEDIPYGIAIAVGALMALPNTVWFEQVASPYLN